jgi:hypothetical protein
MITPNGSIRHDEDESCASFGCVPELGSTFYNYLVGVGRTMEQHPEWRTGQAYFNELVRHHPKLAETVRGTDIDPFYNDAIIPEFLDNIAKQWNDQEV